MRLNIIYGFLGIDMGMIIRHNIVPNKYYLVFDGVGRSGQAQSSSSSLAHRITQKDAACEVNNQVNKQSNHRMLETIAKPLFTYS